ncbi:threonine/homoserine/homoserine lactone efflux protein [Pontibacter ummariensis]|uniref:Threonine/homoserine/homoserine lactone efflux protein n=1 Tax=Pontibacter ummariensis TaxID=1610492 RepID=A0A239LBS4_9BACT|nr:LysE family transporter [Pontibacter ummariensis]PRY03948.1 threonine/homoserine/homoserine lactone efflux protein [Pontibacter ummariensis]SNT27412.1 Threonine/homoserine/homoserine lactone efflux protein [Pontibacter ummariensis]
MNTALSSFIFGLTIAISIGPIALLIINRSINCGLRNGVLSGAAAAFADLTYGIVSFSVGSALYVLLEHEALLQRIASAVLILFGAWMLLGAIRSRNTLQLMSDAPCKGVFASTYALTMANPLTILAFTGFAAQFAMTDFQTIVVNSIALFAGSLIIQITLALFGSALRTYISHPAVIFYLNILSACLIIGLGLMKVM